MKRLIFPLTVTIVLAMGLKIAQKKTSHPQDTQISKQVLNLESGFLMGEIKGVKIKMEIAATPAEREMGLMFRDSLPENQGMLFVFDREEPLSFWMKNTKIPLSIAFLDRDFVIVDIQKMEPLSETTHISARPAMYALEVNQGFFEKHGIGIGDTLRVKGF